MIWNMSGSYKQHRRNREILSPDQYKLYRRERRMERASYQEVQIRVWAERHGCSLRVLNDRYHWLIQKPGFTAEWWPSSAKLVVNRVYERQYHAPHWADVALVLEQCLTTSVCFVNSASKAGIQSDAWLL
jgi:hypothetical protein